MERNVSEVIQMFQGYVTKQLTKLRKHLWGNFEGR